MASPVTRKSGTRSKPNVFNLGRTVETRLAAVLETSSDIPDFQAALAGLRTANASLRSGDLRAAVVTLVAAAKANRPASDAVAGQISIETTTLCKALAAGRPETEDLNLLLVELIAAGSLALAPPHEFQDERLLHAENLICRLTIQLNTHSLGQNGNRLIGAVGRYVSLANAPTHPTVN